MAAAGAVGYFWNLGDFTIRIRNDVNKHPSASTRYVLKERSAVLKFDTPWSDSSFFLGEEFTARCKANANIALVFEKYVAGPHDYKPADMEQYLSVIVTRRADEDSGGWRWSTVAIVSDTYPLENKLRRFLSLLGSEAFGMAFKSVLSRATSGGSSPPAAVHRDFSTNSSDTELFASPLPLLHRDVSTAETQKLSGGYVQSGNSTELQPAGWIQCTPSFREGTNIVVGLSVTIGLSPDDAARAAVSAALATEALVKEAEKKRQTLFGGPVSELMRSKGFDPQRFNIALVGANNTGKSTLANMLFFASHTRARFKQFISEATKRLSELDELDLPSEAETNEAAALRSTWCRLLSSYEPHLAREGRTTTFDMENSKDLSVWFPNATLWDLPGLEAQEGDVHSWAKKVSMNYFDAVIFVCEKQFSTDDFWLLQHAQQAIVDGSSKSVPVFLVRSKMDIPIYGEFREFVDEGGGKGRDWTFDWSALSRRLRGDMLEGLELANKIFTTEDSMLAMSTENCLDVKSFYFLGKVENLDGEVANQRIPFSILQDVHRIFETQAALIRRRLMGLAQRKASSVSGSEPPAAYGHLEAAILCLEPPFDPPEFEEHEVRIDVGAGLEPDVGFGVKYQRKEYHITAPGEGAADKRATYDICTNGEDVLREFPTGTSLGRKLDLVEEAQQVGQQFFNIVIGKERKEGTPCFETSTFKQLHGRILEVTRELYDLAQEGIVRAFAKKHGASQTSIQDLLESLRSDRAESSTIETIALSDWTSGEVLENDGRGGEVEFCSMVNDALRCDAQPALTHACTFLRALKVELVADRANPQSSASLIAKIPSKLKDEAGMLIYETVYRGLAMPDKNAQLFKEGMRYRVPFFLATSFKEHIAHSFADRSLEEQASMRKVVFHFDISDMPLHAAFVQSAPPAPQGEFEFLFVPYSCFEVMRVTLSCRAYVIKLKAFPCNKEAPGGVMDNADSWELMTWH
eukprot:TRINITY_DN24458_c0_g1_i1.p1 TRINITY_DN24458_c0_g1~~TRINITY_DN24458_c0_g1_i1.p1  ORF type:complete len:975 (-),score=220.01 TRINITY_DN24458_c0_g1_i1:496-3420(-)